MVNVSNNVDWGKSHNGLMLCTLEQAIRVARIDDIRAVTSKL